MRKIGSNESFNSISVMLERGFMNNSGCFVKIRSPALSDLALAIWSFELSFYEFVIVW